MRHEYYTEFGPRYPGRSDELGMRHFVAEYVASAIIDHGLRVRGPYKVRHHRGSWIQVFEFTSTRCRDVAAFIGEVDNLGHPAPSHWVGRRDV